MRDEELVGLVRSRVPGLRSLFLFGSCLSPSLRKPDSIPDLFAVVDDTAAALAALGASRAAQVASRWLAPATVAFAASDGAGHAIAKLNVSAPDEIARALRRPRDLTLAGRLAKRTEVLFARDAAAEREIAEALALAPRVMAGVALLAPPRGLALAAASRRCFALSYLAEIRPEPAARVEAGYRAFAAFYDAHYRPHLLAVAAERGLTIDGDCVIDRRSTWRRLRERVRFWALIASGRARSLARWPKSMLLYRGWLGYIVAKIRRARRLAPTP